MNKILLSCFAGGLLGFAIAPLIHKSIQRDHLPNANLHQNIPSKPRESTKEPNVDTLERSADSAGFVLAINPCRPMHLKSDDYNEQELRELYAKCETMLVIHIDKSPKAQILYDCKYDEGQMPVDEDCTSRFVPLNGTTQAASGAYVNSKVLNDGWRVFSRRRLRDRYCGTTYIGNLSFTHECITAYMLVRPLR